MDYNFPYLILFIFYVLLFVIERLYLSNKLVRKLIRIVSATTFILFFGFRGYVGTDWYNYEISYSLTSWNQWLLTDYEPGYSALAKSFKFLGLNYFSFVAFVTTLQVLLFDKFISRYSKTIPLCYVILVALFPVAIIDLQRNLLSILIVINGFHYLDGNKKYRYYLFVIISMLFHMSSIVFFILPFLRKAIIKREILIIILFGGLVVYFSQINFYKDTLLFIGSLFGGGIEHLISHAVRETETAYGLSIGIIEKLALFVLMLLTYNKLKKIPPLVVNACFIYILIYLYFSTSQSFINRFALLFFWGYMLVYCYLTIMLLGERIYLLMVALLIFCFIRTYSTYSNILYYYRNIIFQVENYNNRKVDRQHFYRNR